MKVLYIVLLNVPHLHPLYQSVCVCMNTEYYCTAKCVQIVTEFDLTVLMALVCSGVVCCCVYVCVYVCVCVYTQVPVYTQDRWVRVCVLP